MNARNADTRLSTDISSAHPPIPSRPSTKYSATGGMIHAGDGAVGLAGEKRSSAPPTPLTITGLPTDAASAAHSPNPSPSEQLTATSHALCKKFTTSSDSTDRLIMMRPARATARSAGTPHATNSRIAIECRSNASSWWLLARNRAGASGCLARNLAAAVAYTSNRLRFVLRFMFRNTTSSAAHPWILAFGTIGTSTACVATITGFENPGILRISRFQHSLIAITPATRG